MIAFARFHHRSDVPLWADIFTIRGDGTGQRQLTRAPRGFVDGYPSWSRDGSRLIFTRCGPKSPCAVWSVRSDGSAATRLSPFCPRGARTPPCVDDSGAALSPDGRKIAFHRFSGRGLPALVVTDARLLRPRRIALGELPAWSPDGRRLVFIRLNEPGTGLLPLNGRALFVADADGTNVHRITPWNLKPAADRPDWSPDGKRILFLRNPTNGDFGSCSRCNLYTVRPDGTGLRQVSHFPTGTQVLQAGSFSPDGSSIVFATTAAATPGSNGGLQPDLFVMSADGTDIRPLTRSENWEAAAQWGPRR
jgi:Tol biopolymer transport system component